MLAAHIALAKACKLGGMKLVLRISGTFDLPCPGLD